jgi:hypothetical protein
MPPPRIANAGCAAKNALTVTAITDVRTKRVRLIGPSRLARRDSRSRAAQTEHRASHPRLDGEAFLGVTVCIGPAGSGHRGDAGAKERRRSAFEVRSIGVSWGYHDAAELLKAGAGTLIHDYSELDAAIERVLE